jgi:hypothetical protein
MSRVGVCTLGAHTTGSLFTALCSMEECQMSGSRKFALLAATAISAGACLGCLAIALSLFHYQPAVVAAPGYEMRWVTRPDPWASVVNSYQSFFEIRPCGHTLLGWSTDGRLFYRAACQNNTLQAWTYDPERRSGPRSIGASPPNLLQEPVPRGSILERVRSPCVRPADAEPMVRNLGVRVDGLASPDGRWIAVVVRHIYGPEDVLILGE